MVLRALVLIALVFAVVLAAQPDNGKILTIENEIMYRNDQVPLQIVRNMVLRNVTVDCTGVHTMLVFNSVLCDVTFINIPADMVAILIHNHIYSAIDVSPACGGNALYDNHFGNDGDACPNNEVLNYMEEDGEADEAACSFLSESVK